MDENGIYVISSKKEEQFLRAATKPFSFSSRSEPIMDGKTWTKKETNDLISRMRKIMKRANGVGLSANQIGLPYQLFVAGIHDQQGNFKFYAVFNPKIEKSNGPAVLFEEGCLSIPGAYGHVSRAKQVVLSGFDKTGKPLKIKAWGLLAIVFQHETDHLNGKLFTDRAKEVTTAPTSSRLKNREEVLRNKKE
jgi:peptide deformylase